MGTFVTALVSMVVVPKGQRVETPLPVQPRPETLSVAADAAMGRVRYAQAESALVAKRAEAAVVATAAAAAIPDTVPAVDIAVHDSLEKRINEIEALLTRAEQAPLLTSYKTLADIPELRGDARVRALLDTLADIEREREGFGAVGGVDPVFVALTSRAREVGRAIQAIAGERRDALVARMTPTATADSAETPATTVDTATHIATRDSIQLAVQRLEQELQKRRATSREMDLEDKRARDRANAVAPPLALLASAFVLSWVIGFGVAFIGELRKPRISSASELERLLGVRVLSTVETPMPSVERGRRQADRAAPPYFDPGAEGYQFAYLGLATDHPSLLVATVTGDDPAIAAVVTCNLAAVAADEARNTLVVDLEPTCSASAVLRSRVGPGVTDIIRHGATWPDVTTMARIGRDKTVDLVPFGGVGVTASSAEIIALLKQDCMRLARYYDAVFLLAAANDLSQGLPAVLPSPDVIYCAQPGITPLRQLRAQLDSIRAAGGSIRGVVLWETERPLIPTAAELARSAPSLPRAPREPAVTA